MIGKSKIEEITIPGKDVAVPCACFYAKDVKKKCCKKYKKGKQCRRCPKR